MNLHQLREEHKHIFRIRPDRTQLTECDTLIRIRPRGALVHYSNVIQKLLQQLLDYMYNITELSRRPNVFSAVFLPKKVEACE